VDRPLAIFATSVLLGFVTWSVVSATYVWPRLRMQARVQALRPLLTLHSFRFIGLAFLVPGVVGPDLPAAFARPAAYGDLVASLLALSTLATLHTRVGVFVAWIFNVWGTADLLYAFYQGIFGVGVQPGQWGATYFIPTVLVPLLLITHGLMFAVLMRPDATHQVGGPL
jgi:hypothetical protein